MLLSLNGQQPTKILHPRAPVHPHAKLPLPSHCQTEDKQRGVCEPRDPVAAAVPEERHQQDEEIQTSSLKAQEDFLLSHHTYVTCNMRSSGLFYSTYPALCIE